jgi:AcrR family transcriptional regulator
MGPTGKRESKRPGVAMERDADRDRTALLVAGEAVITELGFAGSSGEEIARRAGVPTEVFQAEFVDLSGLLRGLSARFAEQMMTVTEQATHQGVWKGAAARDVVEVAVRSIVDVILEREGLVRELLAHGATDPSLSADLRRIGAHMSARIAATFAECTNVPVRPARTLAFSLLIAASLAHHHILVGDGWSGATFTKAQLAEEASTAICAYLGLQPTFAVKQESQDLARTQPNDSLKTSEYEAVDERDG